MILVQRHDFNHGYQDNTMLITVYAFWNLLSEVCAQ